MNLYRRRLNQFASVLLGLSLVFIVSPHLASANFRHRDVVGNKLPQYLVQSTPDPSKPVLPNSELERFVDTALVFTHPETRKVIENQAPSVKTITENPKEFDGIQYSLQGRVVKISQVQNLLPEDWPIAYVFTVNDKSANLQILFRGDGKSIKIGDQVFSSGVFVGATNALNADILYKVYKPTKWFEEIPKNLVITLIILLLMGIFPVIILIMNKKMRILVLSMLILLNLSACELDIENIVHINGIVSTSIKISESTENMNFFRDVPGMKRYISGWITNLRKSGSKIDNWVVGKQEYYHLQNKYPDLESFSNLDNVESEEIRSWVYLVSYESGNRKCFRYVALIDPQTLYVNPPNTDPSVIQEMNKEIDKIKFNYGVNLPGQIIFNNADSVQENHLEWQLRMKKANQIIAESCSFIPIEVPNWLWVWLGALGIGLIDLGLWIIVINSLILRRKKMKLLKE